MWEVKRVNQKFTDKRVGELTVPTTCVLEVILYSTSMQGWVYVLDVKYNWLYVGPEVRAVSYQ